MRVIEFNRDRTRPIDVYQSVGASSLVLGDGTGETHIHFMHFEPDSVIGEHAAGFGQMFLVVNGSGRTPDMSRVVRCPRHGL